MSCQESRGIDLEQVQILASTWEEEAQRSQMIVTPKILIDITHCTTARGGGIDQHFQRCTSSHITAIYNNNTTCCILKH